jgi:succinyl-diaminopimelate desuccinylase
MRSLHHVLKTAEELGFRTENVDNHLGWCEYGEGEEMIAVLGHLDVVPAGDGWTVDPYGGEVSDGKIWGRGTTDDKGPTIASLFALAALRDSGLPITKRIRLLFGCNEETGSADVKYYLAQGGEGPVMGFTPDGAYPVINGEKGIINVTFGADYTQEGELKLLSIQGGTAPNVVPAAAYAKLGCSREIAEKIAATAIPKVTFTVTEYGLLVEAEGVSAHGSTPGLGENAIGRLLQALDTLPLSQEVADPIHFAATKLGMETDGKSAGIYLYDDVSGELTLNLGKVVGDHKSFSMKINYRYPVTREYSDCGPAFNKAFTDAGFTVDSEVHKAKLYIPSDSELVSTLLKVYTEQTGLVGKAKCIGGGTYAKMLPNTLAFGPIFPGDEIREHKPDEYITIENLIKNAQIIAAAMYEMAK